MLTMKPVTEVIPTSEARSGFLGYVRGFRDNPRAAPVVVGAHRRAEAVIISFDSYLGLLDRVEDAEIRETVNRRLSEAGDHRLTTEQVLREAGLEDLLTDDLRD